MSTTPQNTSQAPQQVIKLSLNYPALERLLGGNSELETELRMQVAKQFVKNHLVPLMTSDPIKELLGIVKGYAKDEIEKKMGKIEEDFRGKRLILTPEFQETLKAHITRVTQDVLSLFEPTIKQVCDDKITYWKEIIDKRVQEAIDDEVVLQVKGQINKRLAQALLLP